MIKALACLGICAALLGSSATSAQNALAPVAVASEPIPVGGMLAGGSLWREYSARFIDPSGRVIDTGNGGISHSEGQGYGMLIAVAAGDRAGFDRMWAWTRAELGVRYDHLFGWKWDPGRSRAVDANNASDGDLLIAWALAEAAAYWNDSGFLVDATKIVADIESKLIRRYSFRRRPAFPRASARMARSSISPIGYFPRWPVWRNWTVDLNGPTSRQPGLA